MNKATKDVSRVLPRDADALVKDLVPTRGVIEVRLYDFDSERYRYLPTFRQQFTIVSVAELNRLWRILKRAIVVGEEHWRDKNSPLPESDHVEQETELSD